MSIYKNISYKSILLLFLVLSQKSVFPVKNSFLVTPESQKSAVSKNELKENVGQEMKDALYKCAAIASKLGDLQRKLAALQYNLLSQTESLVANKQPFKSSKKKDLNGAVDIMVDVKNELGNIEQGIEKIVAQMESNICLKKKTTIS